ncbi:PAS domain S-box-containing protein [Nitrospirillum amazonense]|uniref:histidine kinase n=1 Tax=Nitrospirillum amazonense TaxID=28077 RepID=A0A560EWK3_9PROT|nr:response regulator [Nitrospirillum amazonense]TWB13747.1 PAS domain S-box-containing protein [Nitrospirillum amazonense]
MIPGQQSLRTLILTPMGRDAKIAAGILDDAGLSSFICADMGELHQQLLTGAGMVLVTEEALLKADPDPLFRWVAEQPSWSDLPFIVLTLRSTPVIGPTAQVVADGLGNVTFVERPFRPTSLVSVIRSAARGRRRQYEARSRIEELRENRDLLARQTHMLELLNRTAMQIAAGLDLRAVGQRVIDAGVELTGAAYGAFHATATGGAGQPFAWSGAQADIFTAFPMPLDLIRSDDIARDRRHDGNGLKQVTPRMASYLAVPVLSRSGDRLGGLFFGHPDAGVFDERSALMASGLAAQAGVAMDNARLFQNVQDANATLEARVEERTRERDRMWRLSNDLMAVLDAEGALLSVNHAWTTALGWPEEHLRVTSLFDLVHPEDAGGIKHQMRRLKRGDPISNFEGRLRAEDGSFRRIAWTASPDEGLLYTVGRDITAQREIEEQLRQSQKMEAVGQLTGGIAHDFNNLLQGITGSLDLVNRRLMQGRTSDVERFTAAAMASANRAGALTHRLLAFSRRQPLKPTSVDANSLVASMAELLRRSLGERIDLELMPADGLWPTLCDPNQLENAILNLCINARDAMPDGGRLLIGTRNVHLDGRHVVDAGDVRPGRYVCVFVTDTGMGMSPETIRRAFDPFFTTKPLGQGTGLGLSMIYGFMRQSEGYARIESDLGKGTTVKLYLPHHGGQTDAPAANLATLPEDNRARSDEVVLVVEDEPVVRKLIVELLGDLGYRVLEADDGPSGLAILQSDQQIDLLITDVGLPGLNGRQIADAARPARPGLKVLFMTGYAENAMPSHDFLAQGMELITKPFPMDVLAQRLRKIMAQ